MAKKQKDSKPFNPIDLVLWVVIVAHVFLCPYTKVEESFNFQAIHDMLIHGKDISKYDHNDFPGVVPRTFLGAVFIAICTAPMRALQYFAQLPKWTLAYAARIVLGTWVTYAFSKFRRAVAARCGNGVGNWLVLLTAAQFHLPFYASRTLPNTLALIPVLYAYAHWMSRRPNHAIGMLAFAAAVFRSELILLCGAVGLWTCLLEPLFDSSIRSRRRGLVGFVVRRVVMGVLMGIAAAAAGAVVSILLDSQLWGKWLWPEAEVFYFNTFLNKSAEWGVMSWHWYFTSALPRALLMSYPLAALSLLVRPRSFFAWTLPGLLFVAAYSFLPHKEVRFIFYALPLLTLAAAQFMGAVFTPASSKPQSKQTQQHAQRQAGEQAQPKRKAAPTVRCIELGILLIAASLAGVAFMVHVSRMNYPGGQLFWEFHEAMRDKPFHLHISSAIAMSGVSRFWEEDRDDHVYDKTEGIWDPEEHEALGHTHVMREGSDHHPEIFSKWRPVDGMISYHSMDIPPLDQILGMWKVTRSPIAFYNVLRRNVAIRKDGDSFTFENPKLKPQYQPGADYTH